MPHSPDVEVMRGLWRKANREADGITLTCRSESEAKRIRFQLYNAVRDARKGLATADQELVEAVTNCSLGFRENDPKTLVLRQRMRGELLQTMAELAGDAVRPQAVLEDSAKRVMERLAQGDRGVEVAAVPVEDYIPGVNAPLSSAFAGMRKRVDYTEVVKRVQSKPSDLYRTLGEGEGDAEQQGQTPE